MKDYQIQILELKSTTKMKISLQEFNKFKQGEKKRISKLEDKIIYLVRRTERKMKESKQSLRDL